MSSKVSGNIDASKQLMPKKEITMSDAFCECCGRPWEELEPFGQVGDEFYEGRLWKTHRPDFLPDKEFYRIMNKFFGKFPTEEEFWKAKERLLQKYGKEKLEELTHYFYAGGVGSSWECVDCICLTIEEYFEKRRQAYSKAEENIDMPTSP